ncbi:MAG TPA: hypothetical protein DEH78_07590 [Solibacterales bacterium]|nr:hypothetical protein [Bryobacterales bacterium]
MASPNGLRRREFLFAGFPFFWRNTGRARLAGIDFLVRRTGQGGRRYLLIHGDESTARRVLLDHMKTRPGVAHLVINETRTVAFEGGKLDPNRLFSRAGAERNLRRLNPSWTQPGLDRALDRLDRERPKLLRAILPARGALLVALHNNARGYSMQDEIPISDRTALNEPQRPHEFMLATSPADFERLANGPHNVLLQSRPTGDDDGSLSRLAAREGIRYVNIEAGIGEQARQSAMLEFLERSLP